MGTEKIGPPATLMKANSRPEADLGTSQPERLDPEPIAAIALIWAPVMRSHRVTVEQMA
ncbi:hypothetical protein SAMCFNEI73_pC1401 (plasmid) [Sinorhizobium americanum]|uniref:Uncharacterized protein n=1 Tax=Sinorhizobium americanum TaxID=194963 RepID=A0A1L3LYB3_9HYPH|nr:hypothetical protein [Sinorhizobium americanum]APG95105.1 hypothetical protein SAMCFNEI73_pC1401 [Sinorhizobium americanum]